MYWISGTIRIETYITDKRRRRRTNRAKYRFVRNLDSVPLDEKLIGKIWNGFALARNVCNGIGATVGAKAAIEAAGGSIA